MSDYSFGDDMSPAEAKAMSDSRWWVDLPAHTVAMFQLRRRLLCMPFDAFHVAVESALGRPVFTHEFASLALLIDELLGGRPAPSFADIVELIPAEKRVLILLDDRRDG